MRRHGTVFRDRLLGTSAVAAATRAPQLNAASCPTLSKLEGSKQPDHLDYFKSSSLGRFHETSRSMDALPILSSCIVLERFLVKSPVVFVIIIISSSFHHLTIIIIFPLSLSLLLFFSSLFSATLVTKNVPVQPLSGKARVEGQKMSKTDGFLRFERSVTSLRLTSTSHPRDPRIRKREKRERSVTSQRLISIALPNN